MRFLLGVAALAVLTRFVLMDQVFFRLLRAPSHDFGHGLAFFTTSMHSLFVSGDLAWWWPGSLTGYGQYYLALLGPVAPTYGHIVFIAWAHLVAMLATLGVHLPEYYQYLVVNYMVLPFLAYAAFGYFCTQFLRRRGSVVLAVAAYAFSGIGLWNSAWFYFQEGASLFFLLGSTLAVLRLPTPSRFLVCLAAVLVQFASLNYWTVYNIFFVAIVLGLYGAIHPNQVRRLVARVLLWMRRYPRASLLVGAGVLGAIAAWSAVIAASLAAQAGHLERAIYTNADALSRIQETATFTTELFNPSLDRALQAFPQITLVLGKPVSNAVHSARYIGMLLLPLALLAVFSPWSRTTRWLLASALLVFMVCVGSPVAVYLWSIIPFMDRIQHVFHFYTQYWQILIVLVAGVGMDRILAGPMPRTGAVLWWISLLGIAASALMLPNVWAAVLLCLACLLLFQWTRSRSLRQLSFASAALLLVFLADLSFYFYKGSRADMAFTLQRGWRGAVPSEADRAVLRSPWPQPDTSRGFPAGLTDAQTVQSGFWPVNIHTSSDGMTFDKLVPLWHHAYAAEPFLFFDGAQPYRQEIVPLLTTQQVGDLDSRLLVDGTSMTLEPNARSRRVKDGFAYEWKKWDYNGYDVDVVVPSAGWILVRQAHDPAWRITLDGTRTEAAKANYISTAVPVTAGRHQLRGEYRPLARAFYWWAAATLEIVLAVLLVLAWNSRRRGVHPAAGAERR